MATVVYHCLGCEAPLRFDAVTGKMVCDYCGSSFTVEEAKAAELGKESEDVAAAYQNEKGEYVEINEKTSVKDMMSIYTHLCPTCGGELMGDEHTAATFCVFCGNPTLNEAVLTKALQPSRIIPFKKTKEEAKAAFAEWGKKGFLTPRSFTSDSNINKITGIYVPFWLYDVVARCEYKAEGRNVDVKRHKNYTTYITDIYAVYRDVTVRYLAIPADASKKMDDSMMDRLEPFDYSELVPFDMAYLSGFFAEKYNFKDVEMRDRIEKRVIPYVEQAADDTITEYDQKDRLATSASVKWGKTEYVMLPVWVLNYEYKGEQYEFAMNGQTGAIVGRRPVDKNRKWLLFGLVFVAAFVLSFIIVCCVGVLLIP